MRKVLYVGLAAGMFAAAPALAQSGSHAGSSSGAGHAMSDAAADVKTAAVIHKIDADKGTVNVTHEPIPAISWPKMTMDLPVTKRVDLAKFKAGDKVTITLKQGVDKQYRVTEITPAK